jgi:hypothetical protein
MNSWGLGPWTTFAYDFTKLGAIDSHFANDFIRRCDVLGCFRDAAELLSGLCPDCMPCASVVSNYEGASHVGELMTTHVL